MSRLNRSFNGCNRTNAHTMAYNVYMEPLMSPRLHPWSFAEIVYEDADARVRPRVAVPPEVERARHLASEFGFAWAAFEEWHRDLATLALTALTNRHQLQVIDVSLQFDGWMDGFRTLCAVMRTIDGRQVVLRWNTDQSWFVHRGPGSGSSCATHAELEPAVDALSPTERLAQAVLLFNAGHGAAPDFADRWRRLVGDRPATTTTLCDLARETLGQANPTMETACPH